MRLSFNVLKEIFNVFVIVIVFVFVIVIASLRYLTPPLITVSACSQHSQLRQLSFNLLLMCSFRSLSKLHLSGPDKISILISVAWQWQGYFWYYGCLGLFGLGVRLVSWPETDRAIMDIINIWDHLDLWSIWHLWSLSALSKLSGSTPLEYFRNWDGKFRSIKCLKYFYSNLSIKDTGYLCLQIGSYF